jgi:dTDP-4-dehydrorhamnose reductase
MASPKIFITGSHGLVASRVIELFDHRFEIITPDLPEFDITDPRQVKKIISRDIPDVIIHFAAFTDVNAAEKQRDDQNGSCWQVNYGGTKNILSTINGQNIFLIYISTDMIFPGNETDPGPYAENHQPAIAPSAITWYAQSKLAGEKLINTSTYAIVRINYPVRSDFPGKLDYLRGPLQKFDSGTLYPLFNDQIVSITFIDELAAALGKIIDLKTAGVYHVSSADTGTPLEIITYLLQKTRKFRGQLPSASVKQFPPNRYPWYGGLKSEITQQKLGLKFSSWKSIINQLVAQGI